jgi:hypothetical protein
MFIFLSVVRIITTLKKPVGHFVASVTPPPSWSTAEGSLVNMIYYPMGMPVCYLLQVAIRAW